MERNKAREINPQIPDPFNSLLYFLYIIGKVLIKQGTTLHPTNQINKYLMNE